MLLQNSVQKHSPGGSTWPFLFDFQWYWASTAVSSLYLWSVYKSMVVITYLIALFHCLNLWYMCTI